MTNPQLFRIRWRIALVAIVVFAAMAWLVAFPAYKRHRAIQEIERVHGLIAKAPSGPKWLRRWGLGFDRVTWVNLKDTEITDEGLEHLKELTKLEYLDLDGCTQITDAGLMHFKDLTNLEDLHLDSTRISDAGLENLKGLTSLEWLYLQGTQVTDIGLEHLKGMRSLFSLILISTQVTDAGLDHLGGMTNLQQLILYDTQVTDAGVKELQSKLPKCKIGKEILE